MTVELRSNLYNDLTIGQNYIVIGIEANYYRILNDQGRPYLYQPKDFKITNPDEPDDWEIDFADNVSYAYPSQLNGKGFFEDYFDGNKNSVTTFWRWVAVRLRPEEANVRFEQSN